MSVIAPTVSSAQCTCTLAPVLIPADAAAPASTACSSGVSAPSSCDERPGERPVERLTLQGLGCQVHDTTVPTLATGTISVSAS